MDERRQMDRLEAALAGLEIAYPVTPALDVPVSRRLREERASGRKPPLPGAALWSRRRVVVLVAVGLLTALLVAAAARYAIGAFEVRIQPGVTPGPSLPTFAPDSLGKPIPSDEATDLAGFEAELPPGPPPDEAYVVESPFGDPGLAFVWRPSVSYPAIEGTDWGLVLVAGQGDAELILKSVDRFEDLEQVRVDGRRAFWIEAPHVLALETETGVRTFAVGGNVLIWQADDGVSYRLETSLGRAAAIEIAESAG